MTCQWLAFDPCIVLNFLMPSRMLNMIGKFKHQIYNTLWLRQLKSVTWLVNNFESGRNFGNRLEETSKYDHSSAQLLFVDYSSGFGWMWLGFVGHIFPNQHSVNILSHFQLFLWQMFIFSHSKFAGHVPCWMISRAPSQYKDHLFRYGDSHVKDKTVTRPSYL